MKEKFIQELSKNNGEKYLIDLLPKLFQIAEMDSSRSGKIGMEVGSLRERVLIAFFIALFGKKNVITEIPITKYELDVICFGEKISIKTNTGVGTPKLIWTVDSQKATEFAKNYVPKCSMIYVCIDWLNKSDCGGFYYIPLKSQLNVLEKLTIDKYIKLPKIGTNPRGVELSMDALKMLLNSPETKKIAIEWNRSKTNYSPYSRWIEEWRKIIKKQN